MVAAKPMGSFRRVAKYGLTEGQLEQLRRGDASSSLLSRRRVEGGKEEEPETVINVPSAECCEAEGDLEVTKIDSIVGELTSYADAISDALLRMDIVEKQPGGGIEDVGEEQRSPKK